MKTIEIHSEIDWQMPIENPKQAFYLRFMHDPANGLAISVQSEFQRKHGLGGRVIPIQDASFMLSRLGKRILKLK